MLALAAAHAAMAYSVGGFASRLVHSSRAAATMQTGGPGLSARALDQMIAAPPEQRKKFKPPKRGQKRKTEQKAAKSGKGFGGDTVVKRYDRRPAPEAVCSCDANESYEKCCAPCHASGGASDPVALTRARYTAYAYRLPDFLIDTTSAAHEEWQADRAEWKKELLQFCDSFVFEGLELGAPVEEEGGACVRVPFRARLVQKGAIKMLDLLETSTFVREGDRWLYAGGDVKCEATPIVGDGATD